MAIFTGLACASSMLSMFSSVPLVPVAAFMWGAYTSAILLFAGWMLGSVLSYFIARYAGYPIVSKIISQDRLRQYEEKISKRASFLTVLLFRFILPAEIPNYFLGIIRYPFGKYFLASFISELPFAFITAYSGEAFIQSDFRSFILWIFAALALLAILFVLFRKRIKRLEK